MLQESYTFLKSDQNTAFLLGIDAGVMKKIQQNYKKRKNILFVVQWTVLRVYAISVCPHTCAVADAGYISVIMVMEFYFYSGGTGHMNMKFASKCIISRARIILYSLVSSK